MKMTPEHRAKIAAGREAYWAKRKLQKQNSVAPALATTEIMVGKKAKPNGHHPVVSSETIPSEFDWNTSPIPVILDRLNEMKREYERVSQIVLQRTSRVPVTYVCWSQEHKSVVPKSVMAQCKGNIKDGSWCYRDDGYRDEKGQIKPAVVCSQLCYTVFMQNRKPVALSRS